LFSQRKCGILPVGNPNGRRRREKADVLQGTLEPVVLKMADETSAWLARVSEITRAARPYRLKQLRAGRPKVREQRAEIIGRFFDVRERGFAMRSARRFLRRLSNSIMRWRQDERLKEEIEEHLALQTAENLRAGMSPIEARRQARLKFGGVAGVKEDYQAERGFAYIETLLRDARFGLRMSRKSPAFTVIALLTVALGVGANTAIFSLIDALLLRALPVRDPQQLMLLKWSARNSPGYHTSHGYGDCVVRIGVDNATSCSFSHPFFDDLRAHANLFSSITASGGMMQLDLSGSGTASFVQGLTVSGNYFETLGVRPAVGRVLDASDDQPSAPAVAVLSYGYWHGALGSSLSLIGKTIGLNGIPTTIVGVAEERFSGLTPGIDPDLWLPISMKARLTPNWDPKENDAGSIWLVIVGRLKPGVRRKQAEAALSLLFRNEMLYGPDKFSKESDDPEVALLPAQTGLVGVRREYSRPLFILMTAVGILLLIASANVAGLLLARSTARQKEMALRLALGAGRGTILRQLLTEGLLLSLIGAGLGIVLAVCGARAIVAFLASSSDRPLGFVVSIDARVLLFTAVISILTGIFFGLAPAMRGRSVDLAPTLKDAPASTGRAGGRWFGIGNALVVGQIGLTMIVLVGAGLVVRTLQNLRSVDPGFDTRNVLNFQMDPTLAGYRAPQLSALYQTLQSRLSGIPGVRTVSYSSVPLLVGWQEATSFYLAGAKDSVESQFLTVGANFFTTMKISVLQGRDFSAEDFASLSVTANASAQTPGATSGSASPRPPSPRPAIVNQSFVRQYLGSASPLGRRFSSSGGAKDPGYVIVGVVRDAMYIDLRQKVLPTTYVPTTDGRTVFELRTATDPSSIVPMVRSVVGAVDKNLPLSDVMTESASIDQLLFEERLIARLSSVFGVLALVLACVGLYGLLSYEVTWRTPEIGIRMALGAGSADVLSIVVRRGLALAVTGVVVGGAAALGLTRFLGSILFEVPPNDPLTLLMVAAVLLVVAFVACMVPACRAMRLDPMVALRCQ
jgi:predicted permease